MRLRLWLPLAALLLAVPAAAPQARDAVVEVLFTALERQILLDYYSDHRDLWFHDDWDDGGPPPWAGGKKKGLPPGLAKKGGLPPGLAKQLVRNGTLPPGLAGRSLPGDLMFRLPLRPQHHEIIFLDDRALLIDRAANLILDLLILSGR
jgi:hypothetical protein